MTKAASPRADIESMWRTLITTLGYDAASPHLTGSPLRVGRFMADWHTINRKPPHMTVFPNENPKVDEMVAIGGFRFYSLCAHHGLPFFGEAAVGYVPNKKLLGLSKFARITDHFAHRFTTQEVLTHEIAAYLERRVKPLGVGVLLRAEHLCMSMRGVERPGHGTITCDLRGVMRTKPEARGELFALLAK